MTMVRSWQEIKQGSRWVDHTEGECATGAKRSIPPTSLRLKAPYGERIAAFLQHATVTQAQSTEAVVIDAAANDNPPPATTTDASTAPR